MDKRSWLLAFGGGNLSALVAISVGQPPAQRVIARVIPHVLQGANVGLMLAVLFATVSLGVLPILLSATANRFYLLWGLVPGWLVCFWGTARDVTVHNAHQLHGDGSALLVITTGSFLLTCGPISLYRWTQRRKRERLAALQQAMQDAANAAPQEGVWPPPPRFPAP